jgi:hypothetical protein
LLRRLGVRRASAGGWFGLTLERGRSRRHRL